MGVNMARCRVDGEQDRGVEAVLTSENFRQLRQGFLGAVLLVSRDQHDMLALAGSLTSFKMQLQVSAPGGCRAEKRKPKESAKNPSD